MGHNKHAHKSVLDGFVEWDEGDHGSGTKLDLSQIERDREAQEAEKNAREATRRKWVELFPDDVMLEDGSVWITGDDGRPLEMVPNNWNPETTTQDDLIDLVMGGE